MQVPGQPRLIKALPKPDDKPRRKRGGQKYRSMRERFKLTNLRKMRNTIAFGPDAQQEDYVTGETFGTVG